MEIVTTACAVCHLRTLTFTTQSFGEKVHAHMICLMMLAMMPQNSSHHLRYQIRQSGIDQREVTLTAQDQLWQWPIASSYPQIVRIRLLQWQGQGSKPVLTVNTLRDQPIVESD